MMRNVAAAGVHADFVLVYITEAHAQNEWPVGDPLNILQPVSNAERLGIARQFTRDYNLPCSLPVLVDLIDNRFMKGYSAWPIRFFVLEPTAGQAMQDDAMRGKCEARVVFKAQPDGRNTYDSVIPNLQTFLLQRYAQK